MPAPLHLMIFAAFLMGTAAAVAQEPVPLDMIRSDAILLANDPFSPFVKTFPRIESGKLVLELRNGFHKPLEVNQVLLREGDSDSFQPLLEEHRELVPAESALVDVVLSSSYMQRLVEQGEGLVEILLSLEPLPDRQPGPSEYRIRFENGRFTLFSKAELSP